MAWTERRGAKWRGCYRLADNRTKGKPKLFDTRAEALTWAEREEALALGKPVLPENQAEATLEEYAKQWLTRRTSVSRETLKRYRSTTTKIIELAPFAQTPVAEVTPQQVEAWFSAQDADDTTSRKTRNYRLAVLRMIYKQAVKVDRLRGADGVVIDDPTSAVKAATQTKVGLPERKRVFLSDREVEAILGAADNPSWPIRTAILPGTFRLLVMLGTDAGLRWGEMAGLAISDIYLDGPHPYLWIWRTTIPGAIQESTKNGKPRKVFVGEALGRLLRIRVREMKLLGSDLLLPRSATDLRPLSYETYQSHFANLIAAAGIAQQPQGWHDLRHTYGSRLAEDPRMTVRNIAQVMGHSQEDVTRRYLHPSQDETLAGSVVGALNRRSA